MLTIISGNNRNGYPYALNKVGDIFQCAIPPFETEGLIDLGKASQKEAFSLAGSLRKIFCSVNVASSDSAEVTVSMTSRNSAGYGKWEPCSSLAKVRKCNFIKWLNDDSGSHFSPESAKTLVSAKSRQHQIPMPEVTVTSRNTINGLAYTHMVGGCADNLLNTKAYSAFVQTEDKEKGPRQALRIMQLLTCEEANELHHNSYLQATSNLSYSRRQHLKKTGAGPASPNFQADISRYKRFFYVRNNQRCAPIMVGRSGGALALAGFLDTGLAAPIRLATLPASGGRGSKELIQEATAMVATTQTRPEFIDTYWIIPEYETTPYGKVSLTRQDRRTFIAMFKDSRLIWAGRKPVKDLTENVICTQLQKLPIEGMA